MAFKKESEKPLTYSSYLKIEELLELQQPRSEGPEHDEMLFIVIHQVYELWFRQVIHEIEHLFPLLRNGASAKALGTLKRILTIFKTLVAQVDVLETMTPIEFNSFRARLESASGFQSVQFREVEFLLGARSQRAVSHHPEGSHGHTQLGRRLHEPSLWDAFLVYLAKHEHSVPETLLTRDVTQKIEPNLDLQQVLLKVYHHHPVQSMVCERLIDLDEAIQEWRYRHVKMVERTIGAKIGSGGSSGAEYLRKTLFSPIFPDLWDLRSQL